MDLSDPTDNVTLEEVHKIIGEILANREKYVITDLVAEKGTTKSLAGEGTHSLQRVACNLVYMPRPEQA